MLASLGSQIGNVGLGSGFASATSSIITQNVLAIAARLGVAIEDPGLDRADPTRAAMSLAIAFVGDGRAFEIEMLMRQEWPKLYDWLRPTVHDASTAESLRSRRTIA
jgi:hypothetical protein